MSDKDALLAQLAQETGASLKIVTAVFDKAAEFTRNELSDISIYNRKAWNRIKTGLNILVEINSGPQKGRYASRILNRVERVVTIVVPQVSGSPVVLKKNTEVIVRLRDEDLAIGFNAIAGDYQKKDPPTENLIITGNLVAKSLRRFPRVMVRVLCDFRADADPEGGAEASAGTGMTKDISCGGVQIVTDDPGLKPGRKVYLGFQLPESPEFRDIPIKIVYKADRERPTYGASFIELPDSAREVIQKFVSEQLLKLEAQP